MYPAMSMKNKSSLLFVSGHNTEGRHHDTHNNFYAKKGYKGVLKYLYSIFLLTFFSDLFRNSKILIRR
jgi:hypothetical protein